MTNRIFPAYFLLFAVLVVHGGLLMAAQPNVILIYSDDQGTLALGCYGTEDIRTPHLDGLAAGIRFTQMYIEP